MGRRPRIFLIISPFPSGQKVSGSIALEVFHSFQSRARTLFFGPNSPLFTHQLKKGRSSPAATFLVLSQSPTSPAAVSPWICGSDRRGCKSQAPSRTALTRLPSSPRCPCFLRHSLSSSWLQKSARKRSPFSHWHRAISRAKHQ